MAENGIYRGWIVVAAACVCLVVCSTSLVVGSFGVLLRPLAETFGWTRAEVSGAISAHVLASVVALPLVGRLIDRFGVKPVATLSILSFSVAFASLYFLNGDPWQLWAIYGLTALLGAGAGPIAFTKVVARWFDRRRGLALGLALGGVGMGPALATPVAQFLVETYGLRATFPILAVAPLVVALPLTLLVFDNRGPEDLGLRPDGGAVVEGSPRPSVTGKGVAEVVRDPLFWSLGLAFALFGVGYTGVATHTIAMLTDRGADPALAVTAQTVTGLSVVAGRFLTGFLMDRVFGPWVAAGCVALSAAGVLVLIAAPVGPAVVLGAILLGLAAGAEIDVMAYMVARYFGQLRFSSLYGGLNALFYVGVAVGPAFIGRVRDTTGGYAAALPILLGVLAASAIVFLLSRRYPDVAPPIKQPIL